MTSGETGADAALWNVLRWALMALPEPAAARAARMEVAWISAASHALAISPAVGLDTVPG
jgi:hypothetical protein